MSSRYRLLIGLVLVAALAWGASPDLRATAKAAAKATAEVTAKAAPPAKPAVTTATANGPTAATAKAAAKAPAKATMAPGAPQKGGQGQMPKMMQTTQAQRQAAAANKKKAGAPTIATTALVVQTGTNFLTPDYFGPYSNYANSPLPAAPIASVTLTSGGTGYCATPTVTITDLYGIGSGVTASATATGGVVDPVIPFTASPTATPYVYPVVTITDCALGTGTGAAATAAISPTGPYSGGLRKFIDRLPLPAVMQPDPTLNPNPTVLAVADTTTFPGTDYYMIELVEYRLQMHGDLPPVVGTWPNQTGGTLLRGYRQVFADGTGTAPSYLGPIILAQKDRPTRIKFTNKLPVGAAGDLFIPTDTSVMGSGTGYDPTPGGTGVDTYKQNRATLHLHGGLTPWISDGTPHQWVVPAAETTNLRAGVSTEPVPDMPLPSGDSMTFYWTNQQSGRLMFYHDHAYGITRLNVYAGEAAGYLLRDNVEAALETAGIIPGLTDNIPLVIQDRTFVWGAANATPGTGGSGTFAVDPTWAPADPTAPFPWAQTEGSLWYPHVYMTNQNPWDVTGANAMGRWDYALWFWPPFNGLLAHGTVTNPYAANPGEPPSIPGTPNPSLTPEAFMDTPVVNGKAYPVLQVDPKAYRFRILNAANDRFWNLSLFQAVDKNSPTTAGTTSAVPCSATSIPNNCTEVAMVPATPSTTYPFPDSWLTASDGPTVRPDILDGRIGGVPDPTYLGPSWIQIGTEGGLLPAPVVIPPSPIGYQYNPRNIVIGNVTKHSLFLGPAERADVIVDFSAFAGKTLIVYNDSPAPVPAFDSRIDYYTGDVDQTSTGGAPPTVPGYGPNTRTVMQIQVSTNPAAPTFDLAALQKAFTASGGAYGTGTFVPGAFAQAQDPILVPQAAYNSAYGTNYTDAMGKNQSTIQGLSLTFPPLGNDDLLGPNATINFAPKAIQELFELDYGRMNATLGVELPFTNGGNQTTLPMGYVEPATELINTSGFTAAPVQVLGDGTQIWKLTHNGVDTHAVHVHLFNAQIVNRVGWDGAIRMPAPEELGWKETIKMSPLEDIILALRPTTPKLPFGLPDSVRLMAPALAPGTLIDTFDTTTGNPMTVPNATYNFGWEYVWHCHLLGHEENDMMRPMVFNAARLLSPPPTALAWDALSQTLTWTDGTPVNYANPLGLAAEANNGNAANEIGFRVERADVAKNGKIGTYVPVALAGNPVLANHTTFTDSSALSTNTYSYRVVAFNAAGDSVSAPVSAGPPIPKPAAPTALTATVQAGPKVLLTFTDNATNELNFVVDRAVSGSGVWTTIATLPARNNTGSVSYTDSTVAPGTTYDYRVSAVNGGGASGFATLLGVVIPAKPGAPTITSIVSARSGNNNNTITLTWTAGTPNNQTGFTIQRATNSAFSLNVVNTTVGNVFTTTITVPRGTPGVTTYYFHMLATGISGSSAYSVPTMSVVTK
jgi:FtsP/CotA-like multicopper oxidase with cupredoxin domain